MELKQVMQRQPGPEVAEQLQIYQQTLKEKTKQMKASPDPLQYMNLLGAVLYNAEYGFRVEHARSTGCRAQNGN